MRKRQGEEDAEFSTELDLDKFGTYKIESRAKGQGIGNGEQGPEVRGHRSESEIRYKKLAVILSERGPERFSVRGW